ncbi:uncharacterized protein CIMG_07806 [Coccidioides immitis RS]|uniref:Uncharacterized protein n=4 Tax=Coccidioides immitis TaxID=5501 RepID=J3K459_COCIM|nr:uncharacterized protein CIMG_07806 [Coccidioides immitis RS]EAS29060.3 hypothetical protein CIMG_07806 [Coccidioides immitis RS]KMP06170.1 hypothetical protein CIRG_05851 [Coccidioides immitis RMSCC 2394]KMU78361.1 hypothetical protein CISG_06597 [Coccidioides immitis RMSCC 3703]KMU91210.1 hypothetical protein CIHG_09022 [Coccidioides immitis H538.4]
MCYQLIEVYSVCRCLYHKHAVDPCTAYGQRGHVVQEKVVLVGYACPRHSAGRPHAVRTMEGRGRSDFEYQTLRNCMGLWRIDGNKMECNAWMRHMVLDGTRVDGADLRR